MTFGWPRIHVPELESTMPIMAAMASSGAGHGTVLTCDYQSNGTGRMGRAWWAPAGSSLLASVLIRTEREAAALPLLSLLVGEAVARAVEYWDVRPHVKWPNDVQVDGRKLSGILLRSQASMKGTTVVIGIGLNLRAAAVVDDRITSIETATGSVVGRREMLDALLPQLEDTTAAFERNDTGSLLASLRSRLALLGETVEVIGASDIVTGMLVDIADDGRLLLRTDNGATRAVHSGEIQRGPRRIDAITS